MIQEEDQETRSNPGILGLWRRIPPSPPAGLSSCREFVICGQGAGRSRGCNSVRSQGAAGRANILPTWGSVSVGPYSSTAFSPMRSRQVVGLESRSWCPNELGLLGWTGSVQWPIFAASPEANDHLPDSLNVGQGGLSTESPLNSKAPLSIRSTGRRGWIFRVGHCRQSPSTALRSVC